MIGVIDYRRRQRPERHVRARVASGSTPRLVGRARGLADVDRIDPARRRRGPRHHRRRWPSPGSSSRSPGRVLDDRLPFLGICIGLQVLFERSEEGPADGLGWLPGEVRRFPGSDRVPQIGWNDGPPRPRAPGHRGAARRHLLLLRELVLRGPRRSGRTCSAPPSTAWSSARSSPATTSSRPSSTRRRAASSGCGCCTDFAAWDGAPC